MKFRPGLRLRCCCSFHFKMAPNKQAVGECLVVMLRTVLVSVSVALQLNFVLLTYIILQHQAMKQQLVELLHEKNQALIRYKKLRSRFIRRSKRIRWKNGGRTELWWCNAFRGAMPAEEWHSNFRMSREDFMMLEGRLRPYLRPNHGSFRVDTMTSFKKLAMTPFYLQDQGSLRMTSNAFGVAKSTASVTIRKVCNALVKVMGPELIKFPTTEADLKELISNFESKFDFPMVIGCVDGTHIPIKQPQENAGEYFCYKMKYSLNVHAICDHRGHFIDVDCSWPGSVHDAKVFANTRINHILREKQLPDVNQEPNGDGFCVPPVLIGDPAYPLLPNVLKEFETCHSDEEVIFNIKLRTVRNQIECAFGRLKARWRILNRPMDLSIEHIPTVVYACFILHNYCELRKCNLGNDRAMEEVSFEKNHQNCSHHTGRNRLNSYDSERGKIVRDCFKKFFGSRL